MYGLGQLVFEELQEGQLNPELDPVNHVYIGDKSFLKQIKSRLGIRAKGRKIQETEDEFQLREGQAVYGAWSDSNSENTIDLTGN